MLRPDRQAFGVAAKPVSCILIRVLYAAEVPGDLGESTGTDIDHECSHHSMFATNNSSVHGREMEVV